MKTILVFGSAGFPLVSKPPAVPSVRTETWKVSYAANLQYKRTPTPGKYLLLHSKLEQKGGRLGFSTRSESRASRAGWCLVGGIEFGGHRTEPNPIQTKCFSPQTVSDPLGKNETQPNAHPYIPLSDERCAPNPKPLHQWGNVTN
ncbi:hypothetical protein H6P81_017219 [Aristolochia fimbriata]|uniref:Uncharacterized protein n=1 Tax=Aristolochia fimbriata TaxID=158543 RepID=A0AAV7DXI8_ARIFI|nr:hypothetical protein H6P81_017219 [Aristolochia fimbriata]